MQDPRAEDFEHDFLAPSCRRGVHVNCAHALGIGGGLNRRRFRLGFEATLCTCSCHSPCPLADGRRSVPFSTWRESCSCPARRRSRSRREAGQAVRAAAAGKSRDEVREMLIAELRARELDVPADDILAASVDAIMGKYGSSIRLLARAFGDASRSAIELDQIFRGRSARPPSDPT